MEEKIVLILNEMSEYLSIAQMKKLQEVICNVGCTARSFENKWSRNTIAAVRKTTEIGSYTSP